MKWIHQNLQALWAKAEPSPHIPMEWVVASDADPNRRILYIHGGSWVSGSLAGYRPFLSRVSQATGAAVLSVDYRLAPEHLFPAGLEDCVQACQWMRENGPDGRESAGATYLMGDSAGVIWRCRLF